MVGGIVGYNDGTSANNGNNIYYCYNKGSITANSAGPEGMTNVGGISGITKKVNIYYCYNKGTVTASATIKKGHNVGGISGQARESSNIYYCYNLSTVNSTSSNENVGGITGVLTSFDSNEKPQSYMGSKTRYCYNAGEVISRGIKVRRYSGTDSPI